MALETESITPPTLIDVAIERLHRVGWTQGELGSREGPNCLLGALHHAYWELLGDHSQWDKRQEAHNLSVTIEEAVAEAINRFENRTVALTEVGLGGWNDQRNRTVEDVLLVLKDARTKLEQTDD